MTKTVRGGPLERQREEFWAFPAGTGFALPADMKILVLLGVSCLLVPAGEAEARPKPRVQRVRPKTATTSLRVKRAPKLSARRLQRATKRRRILEVEKIHKNVNMDKQTGWTIAKQKPLFSPDKAEQLRQRINASTHGRVVALDITGNPGKANASLAEVLGPEAASELISYALETNSIIKAKTKKPFNLRMSVITERLEPFPDGHGHHANSITVTRAEIGLGSWIAPGGRNAKRGAPTKRDEVAVFTEQFHGGSAGGKKRLLVIVFANFYSKPGRPN